MKDVPLNKLPNCDVCNVYFGRPVTAEYDSPVDGGSWGYLCSEHMDTHGNFAIASHLVTY